MMTLTAVSACLAGERCRYDGNANPNDRAKELCAAGALLICPECLSGLPTPREPAEIVGGDGAAVLDGTARVITKSGADVRMLSFAVRKKHLLCARKTG